MIYNFNLGIGWASSGVEYAQAYRGKVLREIGEPAKFIFTDMFYKDNIEHLTKNIGFEDSEIIWLYTFFTDIKIAPVSYSAEQFESSLGNEIVSKEEKEKTIKYRFNKKSDYALAYRAFPDSDKISRVEFVSGGKLVRKDYYSYCKMYTEYYAPLNGEAHMYMRRFFNENGTVAYDEINDDDDDNEVMYKFKDHALYSKQELVIEMVKALKFTEQDIIILDRTSEIGQAVLQYSKPAKVVIVIHADHFSESSLDEDNILWNNYYEYPFAKHDKIALYIASTEAQKVLMEQQFEEVYGVVPKIVEIPVGSIDELKTCDERKKHSVITASRLASEKHVNWVIDAVIKARENVPDITLDIYGKGAEEDKLIAQIADNNAGDYIRLCGHKNLDEIYKHYELYASGSTSEGFGLTLLEAIGSGLPLIGFDARYGNQTFIDNGKNGYIIEVEDETEAKERIDRMAKCIVRLFTEDDIEQCKNRSYEIAEKYLTEKVKEQWIQLLKEMR